MAGKLDRIKKDLKRARDKRDEWDIKVKTLEQKYREAENTMIHEMVHAAKLTPKQLAKLIQQSATHVPGGMPGMVGEQNQEETSYGY